MVKDDNGRWVHASVGGCAAALRTDRDTLRAALDRQGAEMEAHHQRERATLDAGRLAQLTAARRAAAEEALRWAWRVKPEDTPSDEEAAVAMGLAALGGPHG
jgi:hypothetical protein